MHEHLVQRICSDLDIELIMPLWNRDSRQIVTDFIDAGFEVIISAVAAYGLTEDWFGRYVDKLAFDTLCDLHGTCYVCTGGEGGEFETLVVY